jgi:NADH dehydrogenase (ubiquinone) 1 alpha subcomplex subunit 8
MCYQRVCCNKYIYSGGRDSPQGEDFADPFCFLAIFSIQDINTHCLQEFRKHWECLENGNHQLWQCRPAEWKLNKCVYDNLVSPEYPLVYVLILGKDDMMAFIFLPKATLGLVNYIDHTVFPQKIEKVIPDQPKTSTPVHLRPQQIFADYHILKSEGKPFVAPKSSDSKETA